MYSNSHVVRIQFERGKPVAREILNPRNRFGKEHFEGFEVPGQGSGEYIRCIVRGIFRLCAGAGAPDVTDAPTSATSGTDTPGDNYAGTATQAPAPPRQAVPDYPDPRTLMIGVFYFLTSPSKGPDIVGGAQATAYENVSDLGKGKGGPGGEEAIR